MLGLSRDLNKKGVGIKLEQKPISQIFFCGRHLSGIYIKRRNGNVESNVTKMVSTSQNESIRRQDTNNNAKIHRNLDHHKRGR